MVRELNDIFDVVTTLSNVAFTQTSFGESIILEETTAVITDRVAEYESLAEVLAAGYTTSDQIYKMANAYFGQAVRPEKLYIGKKTKTTYNKWTVSFTNGTTTGTFTLAVDSVSTAAIPYNATNEEIMEAVDAALSADLTCMVSGYDYTDTTSGFSIYFTSRDVSTLTSNTALLIGVNSAAGTAVLTDTVAYSLGETWATAIDACRQEDDSAYEYQIANEDFFAIASVAAKIETLEKQFGALTKDLGVVDSGETLDIASYLYAKNYENTALYFTKKADQYGQSAVAGKCLPKNPGSVNWNHQIIAGITPDDKWTAAEDTALEAKRVNYILSLGGQTVSQGGAVMSNGSFRDLVHFKHFISQRIREGLFELLATQDKIEYDDYGIKKVVNKLYETLINYGVDYNAILLDSIVITAPKRADISSAIRSTRVLPNITWSADLTGALNGGTITGILTA